MAISTTYPGYGAVPPVYTVNASNTSVPVFTVGSINTNITTGSNGISWDDIKPNTLEVRGKAVFDSNVEIKGDLKIRGVDLLESIERIEQRLNILRVDPELEERWERLKKLGDEYRELEADILEKEEIMRILKK